MNAKSSMDQIDVLIYFTFFLLPMYIPVFNPKAILFVINYYYCLILCLWLYESNKIHKQSKATQTNFSRHVGCDPRFKASDIDGYDEQKLLSMFPVLLPVRCTRIRRAIGNRQNDSHGSPEIYFGRKWHIRCWISNTEWSNLLQEISRDSRLNSVATENRTRAPVFAGTHSELLNAVRNRAPCETNFSSNPVQNNRFSDKSQDHFSIFWRRVKTHLHRKVSNENDLDYCSLISNEEHCGQKKKAAIKRFGNRIARFFLYDCNCFLLPID
ncbi:hypothetical protein TNCT_159621 [Trichonephila clavata]|uniref:Uncharacterized protein n=1 Tax=Trichonephila clavata TaxID=2740835 RepID=A0A8X6I2C7_TRICU|nr:hypothetical protein TNCT_159621 [Trichonephila clavata]